MPRSENGEDTEGKGRKAPSEEQGGRGSGLVQWAKENPGWAIAVLLIVVAIGIYFYMKNKNTGEVSQIVPIDNTGSIPGSGITSVPAPVQTPAVPPSINPNNGYIGPPVSRPPTPPVMLPPGTIIQHPNPGNSGFVSQAPPPPGTTIIVQPGENVPDYTMPGTKPPIIPIKPEGGPEPEMYVSTPTPTGGPSGAESAKPYVTPMHNYHQIGAALPIAYYGMQYNYPGFENVEVPSSLNVQQVVGVGIAEPGYAGVGASASGALLAREYLMAKPGVPSTAEKMAQAPVMSEKVAERVKRQGK